MLANKKSPKSAQCDDWELGQPLGERCGMSGYIVCEKRSLLGLNDLSDLEVLRMGYIYICTMQTSIWKLWQRLEEDVAVCWTILLRGSRDPTED